MAKKIAFLILATASLVMLACFFIDSTPASWIAAFLSVTSPIALIASAWTREDSHKRLLMFLVLVEGWMLLTLAFLLWPPFGLGEFKLAGFPLTALIMLGGLWLAPLVAVSFVYVKTFAAFEPTEESLKKVRELRQRQSSNRESS